MATSHFPSTWWSRLILTAGSGPPAPWGTPPHTAAPNSSLRSSALGIKLFSQSQEPESQTRVDKRPPLSPRSCVCSHLRLPGLRFPICKTRLDDTDQGPPRSVSPHTVLGIVRGHWPRTHSSSPTTVVEKGPGRHPGHTGPDAWAYSLTLNPGLTSR